MPAAITRYGMASYINMLRAIAEGITRVIRSRQSGNALWLLFSLGCTSFTPAYISVKQFAKPIHN
jgi:hypothetical protein